MVIIHPQDAYGCHKVQERKKTLESPTTHSKPNGHRIIQLLSFTFSSKNLYSVRNTIILSFFVVCFWK
jgi:hypothetical protein